MRPGSSGPILVTVALGALLALPGPPAGPLVARTAGSSGPSSGPYLRHVAFDALGLPTGVVWWVNVSGGYLNDSTVSVLYVDMPNGSYTYRVGSDYAYRPSPTSGSITVGPSLPPPPTISFTALPSWVAGTVVPPNASVRIDGNAVATSLGAFNTSVSSGRHALEVSAPGYATVDERVLATPGNTTPVSVRLVPSACGCGAQLAGPVVSPLLVAGVAGAVVVAAVGLAVLLARRFRRDRTDAAEEDR